MRTVRLVPVVMQCACSRFHTPVVRIENGEATVTMLPDNCSHCGASLDTPARIADLIDTARHLITRRVPA